MSDIFLAILTVLSGAGLAAMLDMSKTLGRIEGDLAGLTFRIKQLED